jgi:transcriptional regulator with XRE-family HTH domain
MDLESNNIFTNGKQMKTGGLFMDFSIRIKHLRHKHKLTQGELAAILGLKSTAISNYESKRNEPSFEKLIVLSKFFNVSCDYLLGMCDSKLRLSDNDNDAADLVELSRLYQDLNNDHRNDVKNFMHFLLFKQNQKSSDCENENLL